MAVKGTLGILEEAANRDLVDFTEAVSKLQATSIFISEEIVQEALKRHREQHHARQQSHEPDRGIER